MNVMPLYEQLRIWTAEQWAGLLRQLVNDAHISDLQLTYCRYYIDSSCVTVRGKPSAELADRIESVEKSRLEAQIANLGEKGLAAVKERLEKAKAENDQPIPTEVLTKFPVPSVSSISWIPVQSYQDRKDLDPCEGIQRTDSSQLKSHIDSDGSKLPFFVQFDHVEVC